MYKLHNTFIDKMIEKKLTSKEIDFILYISNYQDRSGKIMSVYYKDICESIHISVQKFYDILNDLSQKGILTYKKEEYADVSVVLTGNDFSDNNFSNGYLKVGTIDFQNERFTKLKAGSKLLYLYMQRFTSGKHAKVAKFYEDFCELLGVKKKTIQAYIHELKDAALLFVSLKRNKAYNYEMNVRNSSVIHKKWPIPHEIEGHTSNFSSFISRNFKRMLPKDKEKAQKAIHDTVSLIDTQRAKKYNDFPDRVVTAIKESFRIQILEGKKKPILNAAYVNKCLTANL